MLGVSLPKKVVIVGAQGQLARALQRATPPEVEVVALGRNELNIQDVYSVRSALETHTPDMLFNGAAYNGVDRAEGEGATDALNINSLGVANLALACRDLGVRLVHFSTDFVFDGHKREPYTESDATAPLSVYGSSKLCGENIALCTSAQNIVVRVCRLFGPLESSASSGSAAKPGGNFPALMLRLARERGRVRVVDDQIGSPTYNPDLARGVWQLVSKSQGGLFQLCNAGEISFADYAALIFEMAGVSCEIERVSSAAYGAPARRPLYSTLSTQKAQSIGVEPLRDFRLALSEFLQNESL